MKNWTFEIHLFEKNSFLIGLLIRQGSYTVEENPSEKGEIINIQLGLAIVSIDVKLIY
jgi:hypothetical protein